jgi:hypothetical protein
MSFLSLATLAYVGPGAGLGALGALFAVVAAVFLGLVGLVLFPIQMLRRRFAKRTKDETTVDSTSASRHPAA